MSETDHTAPALPSIPAPPTGRHLSARDAIVCIGLCTLLLLAFEGRSIRRSGEEMQPGRERSLVLAVGHPAGAVSDALGLATVKDKLVGWAHPDDALSGPGGFDEAAAGASRAGVARAGDRGRAFDPRARELGAPPRQERQRNPSSSPATGCRSRSTRRSRSALSRGAGSGVRVVRDAHASARGSRSQTCSDWGQPRWHPGAQAPPRRGGRPHGRQRGPSQLKAGAHGWTAAGPTGRPRTPIACCVMNAYRAGRAGSRVCTG
jgi:hypothetical protein